jgi:hypothetical protein
MDYQEYRESKQKQYGILGTIWCQDAPSIFRIYGGDSYVVTYRKTEHFYEVYEGYLLYEYEATQMVFP